MSGTGAPAHFDLCGPLPGPGVTVLEASAGTGKTFTIAALVTRFVAEGTPIAEVLAVTFTRMATGELRDRVRARMVSAEAALSRVVDDPAPLPGDDELVTLLGQGTPSQVAARRDRLAAALTSFDEATITTTHGFCQLMLSGLGVAGDVATAATLLEDPSDILEEVVDDLYVRRTLRHAVPSFTRAQALEIAWKAVQNPATPLVPEPSEEPAGLRRRLADGVRREVQRRLVDANLLTFDDLLVRLKDTLLDPYRGAAAAERLRERFSVVLVDEFQDTDPIQWDVVRTAFGSGRTTLVLIGDPKQAIYAFRGADVYAYLDAAALADRSFTLSENWRSDADLLQALDALFDPAQLGHPQIRFRPVSAAPCHTLAGLRGAPVAQPLRVRFVPNKESGLPLTSKGEVRKPTAEAYVTADLAADIVRLLESPAAEVAYDNDGHPGEPRRLGPGDIAVLVGKNRQALTVQEALRQVGVPAVVAGNESVLSTAAAADWLALLGATEQPANRSRAVGASLTPFIGMSADEVAAAGELEWEAIHARIHRWSAILRQLGVASLFRTVAASEGVPERLLGQVGGERRLTDLGHIARLLHAEASRGHHGPAALRAWLARRMAESTGGEGAEAEERSRWIDSDAEAVQVLTIHRSKGLEFPVVYCPYLWDEFAGKRGKPVVFHDTEDGLVRKLDVSGDDGGPAYTRHFLDQRDEERGEALRKLYVALTRARHQVVLWWAGPQGSHLSALGRLLTAREADGAVAADPRRPPKEEDVARSFQAVAARASGLMAIETVAGPSVQGVRWSGGVDRAAAQLSVAAFERSLDLRWRRTSYSGITAGVHGEPEVGSDPEDPGTTDEPLVVGDGAGTGVGVGATLSVADGTEQLLRAVPSPWAGLPGGVDVGTFVHSVLEGVDFALPDLGAEIRRAMGASARATGARGAERAVGVGAGGVGDHAARPPGRRDGPATDSPGRPPRRAGLRLPLAGGDAPHRNVAVATPDIADLFERHAVPGGPLAGYAARLRDPVLGTDLRGYLNGSLDLVFRATVQGRSRYFVADYKTNQVGARGEELTAWHYRPSALDEEMQRMHYPLQAVFYLVALHRYLRWRLRDYDPEAHVGGALYLFLRGMAGPATPAVDGQPCGVFSWRPPSALVTDLSDLFEAGS